MTRMVLGVETVRLEVVEILSEEVRRTLTATKPRYGTIMIFITKRITGKGVDQETGIITPETVLKRGLKRKGWRI